ncbi:MAG: hypothetical protein ACRC0G_15185 [Fusobacteriaceae bacterium]
MVIDNFIERRQKIIDDELFIYKYNYYCENCETNFDISLHGKAIYSFCPKCGKEVNEPYSAYVDVDSSTLGYLIPHNLNEENECNDDPCALDLAMKKLEPILKEMNINLINTL